MGAALLVCRLLLASVFLVAGVAKLADLAGSRRAVLAFGVPERLSGVVGVLLPAVELAVAVALIPSVTARFGALGAGLLLLLFSAAIANALAHGKAPDCHCFGQVHSAPAGWRALSRNAFLLAVAGFTVIAGWDGPGVSATAWLTRVPAPWLVALAAGLVIVALVSFQAWFSLQLLSQNGRTLARLEALERALQATGPQVDFAQSGEVDPVVLGVGHSGGGLAIGASAPEFELESVSGERYSLRSLLEDGRPLVLVFSDAGCGPCDALLPDLARWQRERAQELQIALIAGGDPERNRAKASEYALEPVLLQQQRKVSDTYLAHGTPMAVAIGPDGRILSPTVGGSEAISRLIAQAARPALSVLQRAPSSNGHQNGTAPPPKQPPDTSRVGQPAPRLELTDLAGRPVALGELYGQPVLALFWNPGCGFCQRMLEDLKAFEEAPPAGVPRLVVISAGRADQVRQQQLRSLVLLDPEAEAMRAFGVGGTPMALLVDQRGRIASPVLAGAAAVLAGARGDPQPASQAG